MKKIIIFGAGKIGRSFIGQLFSRGGYEVVFIDIDEHIVGLLNSRKKYYVIIKGEEEEVLEITNVRALAFSQTQAIINEISSCSIMALSVGIKGLDVIIPLIAEGINIKYRAHPERPVDIIIAENIINGDLYIRSRLIQILGEEFPVDEYIGLIETSIGKMVPIMTTGDLENDPLQVFAEPYNTLILAKSSFRNPIPDVPGLAPKENMKAWVDRKLFIHNLGHAACAYLGYLKYPEATYLYEILAEEEIYDQTNAIMHQSANILEKKYPEEFTSKMLDEHIIDLLDRFRNRALKDTVFRVGCDLERKLGPRDRMVYPVREGIKYGLPVEKIIYALTAGYYFRATDELSRYHPNDETLFRSWSSDIGELLLKVSGIDPEIDKNLLTLVRKYCKDINATFDPLIEMV